MREVVEEVDGEFVIPIAGFVCTYLQNDHELILCDPDSAEEAWLWASGLEGEAILSLIRHKARVARAVAASGSTLRIDFDDGFSLLNPPMDAVEAWELRGPGYVLLIGTPGGGPAVWDATSEIRVVDPSVDPLPAQVIKMMELYPTLPGLAGAFQFRPVARGRDAIELHAPDAPRRNRKEIIRFVLPVDPRSGSDGAYMRYTN